LIEILSNCLKDGEEIWRYSSRECRSPAAEEPCMSWDLGQRWSCGRRPGYWLARCLGLLLAAAAPLSAAAHSPPVDSPLGLGKPVLIVPIRHQVPPCPGMGNCEWLDNGAPAPPRNNATGLETLFNQSINSYYLDATHGQTSFQFTVAANIFSSDGWFTAPHNIQEYIANFDQPGGSNTSGGVSLGEDAVALASIVFPDLTPWSRILVITNFPRRGGLSSSITFQGKVFPMVFLLENSANAALVDLTAHELTHSFGLPDVYGVPTQQCGARAPCGTGGNMGPWDLMANDEFGTHFSAWTKIEAGWVADSFPNVRNYGPFGSFPFSANVTLTNAGEAGTSATRLRFNTSGTHGYLVECRTRKPGLSDTGIPEEGILVTEVFEGDPSSLDCGRHVSALSASNFPNDVCLAPLQPGETYFSSHINGLSVTSGGMTLDECQLQVNYAGSGSVPDVAIATQPHGPKMFDSPDVWIDSPKNGYGTYPQDQPLDGDGAPQGPGDEVWSGAPSPHRVYFRIRNLGTTQANNISVEVSVQQPVVIHGRCDLPGPVTLIATKQIASLAAGATLVTYVAWSPPTGDAARLDVDILPVSGEVTLGNNHTTDAVSFYRYTCLDPPCLDLAYSPDPISTYNPCFGRILTHFQTRPEIVPIGWDVLVAPQFFNLDFGETQIVDVEVQRTAGGGPAGGSAAAAATGETTDIPLVLSQTAGDLLTGEGGHTYTTAGGFNLRTYIVPPGLVVCQDPALPGGQVGLPIGVVGQTDPAIDGSRVSLLFTSPSGANLHSVAVTDAGGSFTGIMVPTEPGAWSAQALWDGDIDHMPAQSSLCLFDVAPANGSLALLLSDDFEVGFGAWSTTSGWATGPADAPASYPEGSGDPVAGAEVCTPECTLESYVFDVSRAHALRLDFRRYLSDLGIGGSLTLWVTNGSGWTPVQSFGLGAGDDDTWHDESIDLSIYAGASELKIRFTAVNGGGVIQLDDIALVAYVAPQLIPTLSPQSWIALATVLLLVTLWRFVGMSRPADRS
jgi:hypothetical protein